MLKSAFEWLNTTLAGMVHKCPYAVSKKRNKNLNKLKNYSFKEIKIVNATYAGTVGDDIPSNWQVLPNGIYKTCLGLSDSLDEKIFEVTFFQETSIRKRFFTDLYMWQLINLLRCVMTTILIELVDWKFVFFHKKFINSPENQHKQNKRFNGLFELVRKSLQNCRKRPTQLDVDTKI